MLDRNLIQGLEVAREATLHPPTMPCRCKLLLLLPNRMTRLIRNLLTLPEIRRSIRLLVTILLLTRVLELSSPKLNLQTQHPRLRRRPPKVSGISLSRLRPLVAEKEKIRHRLRQESRCKRVWTKIDSDSIFNSNLRSKLTKKLILFLSFFSHLNF